jgi:hypothetical protein
MRKTGMFERQISEPETNNTGTQEFKFSFQAITLEQMEIILYKRISTVFSTDGKLQHIALKHM